MAAYLSFELPNQLPVNANDDDGLGWFEKWAEYNEAWKRLLPRLKEGPEITNFLSELKAACRQFNNAIREEIRMELRKNVLLLLQQNNAAEENQYYPLSGTELSDAPHSLFIQQYASRVVNVDPQTRGRALKKANYFVPLGYFILSTNDLDLIGKIHTIYPQIFDPPVALLYSIDNTLQQALDMKLAHTNKVDAEEMNPEIQTLVVEGFSKTFKLVEYWTPPLGYHIFSSLRELHAQNSLLELYGGRKTAATWEVLHNNFERICLTLYYCLARHIRLTNRPRDWPYAPFPLDLREPIATEKIGVEPLNQTLLRITHPFTYALFCGYFKVNLLMIAGGVNLVQLNPMGGIIWDMEYLNKLFELRGFGLGFGARRGKEYPKPKSFQKFADLLTEYVKMQRRFQESSFEKQEFIRAVKVQYKIQDLAPREGFIIFSDDDIILTHDYQYVYDILTNDQAFEMEPETEVKHNQGLFGKVAGFFKGGGKASAPREEEPFVHNIRETRAEEMQEKQLKKRIREEAEAIKTREVIDAATGLPQQPLQQTPEAKRRRLEQTIAGMYGVNIVQIIEAESDVKEEYEKALNAAALQWLNGIPGENLDKKISAKGTAKHHSELLGDYQRRLEDFTKTLEEIQDPFDYERAYYGEAEGKINKLEKDRQATKSKMGKIEKVDESDDDDDEEESENEEQEKRTLLQKIKITSPNPSKERRQEQIDMKKFKPFDAGYFKVRGLLEARFRISVVSALHPDMLWIHQIPNGKLHGLDRSNAVDVLKDGPAAIPPTKFVTIMRSYGKAVGIHEESGDSEMGVPLETKMIGLVSKAFHGGQNYGIGHDTEVGQVHVDFVREMVVCNHLRKLDLLRSTRYLLLHEGVTDLEPESNRIYRQDFRERQHKSGAIGEGYGYNNLISHFVGSLERDPPDARLFVILNNLNLIKRENANQRPGSLTAESEKLLFGLFIQLAYAIRALHHANYTHFDIIPDHLLLDDRNLEIRLLNFHCAHKYNAQTGRVLNLRYNMNLDPATCAPEFDEYLKENEVYEWNYIGPAADIFQFGYLFYLALLNKIPDLPKQRAEGIPPLIERKRGLPNTLEKEFNSEDYIKLFKQLLATHPKQRPNIENVIDIMESMYQSRF